MDQTVDCPYCREPVHPEAIKCKHCGSDLTMPPAKSNLLAGLLGLLLGPVGLLYKGRGVEAFLWVVFAVLCSAASGVFLFVVAPLFWLGMAIHAALAAPRG